jgi:orotidine-5'-phosphate decarboxylase
MAITGNAHRIIVALDVGTRDQAISLVESLPEGQVFKVGLQLFTSEGPSLLQEIAARGKRVFLDLKLHDIPNTVAGAVSSAVAHGAAMLTLHASGGGEMMRRAAGTAAEEAEAAGIPRPLLLGVTILTSLKDAELGEIGMPADAAGQVLRLAGLAQSSGLDGIVCSPLELELVRAQFGKEFLVITPGIRPAWAASQDQKRILTPAKALSRGADYLVIGRPITAAPSPGEAFARIRQELDGADSGSHGKDGA